MRGFRKTAAVALSLIITAGFSSCESDHAYSQSAELIDDFTEESPYEPDYPDITESGDIVTEPPETEGDSFGEETIPETDETIFTGETPPEDTEGSFTWELFPETGETSFTEEAFTESETEASDDGQDEDSDETPDDFSDYDFENKPVKWLSHFDPWSYSTSAGEQCSEETKGAELFKEMYGGYIEWYPTTWEYRFSDLSVYVMGGQGIDFFTGIRATPKCVVDQTVQSYDRYVDWDSPVWSSVRDLNDPFAISGKHYLINCQERVDSVVFYNQNIIRENDLDDPWELYKSGRWTMGKFMEMMEEYTDGKDKKYGLGSYYNSSAQTRLYLSGGVSPVSLKNGRLVNNINTNAFERAMNYQFELYRRGLVTDDNTSVTYSGIVGRNSALQNGDVLFYVAEADFPSYDTSIDIESLGIAPMPRDESADRYYHPMDVYGYYLCKGAENPMGVIKLMECVIISRNDANTQAEIRNFYKTEYGWTDELIERKYEILRLARTNPSFDILPGLPDDICRILDDIIYQQTSEEKWRSARESVNGTLDLLISETNSRLESVSG